MGPIVPVAHDFSCPWCWVGLFQARSLRHEFGVQIEWRGYELYPDGMDLPGDRPPVPAIPNRPETPKRIELALAAQGLGPVDLTRDSATRTHRAHEAVEFAKLTGVQDELVDRIYHAYWKQNQDIDDPAVLLTLAQGLILDLDGLENAMAERRFADRITPYNKPAYATGVFNLPTFWIGEERYAEQPYAVLTRAMRGLPPAAPYATIDFPPSPPDRPYVFRNMVATIDGKTVTGSREETVSDLGSTVDHQAMRHIEASAEAVLIGAQTLRATPKVRFDPKLFRIVISRSGQVDPEMRFFTNRPDRAVLVTPEDIPEMKTVRHWRMGTGNVDLARLLARLRSEWGIARLLVEGGSEVNSAFLSADLADELFLTVAPKVRLGRDLPTYAGGSPLPRGALLTFDLVSELLAGDEVFLRYRRKRGSD